MKTKKEVLEIIDRLKGAYPLAECTLDYDHAWQLLVSVRLAAQCTDARVNIVTEELFAKYPSAAALAEADPADIEAIVKPCGLGHSKARDISLAMRKLMSDFGGRVPDDFDTLLTQMCIRDSPCRRRQALKGPNRQSWYRRGRSRTGSALSPRRCRVIAVSHKDALIVAHIARPHGIMVISLSLIHI